MAEKVNPGIKELEDEITCAICQDYFTEPKVLSSCHYYCKQCIYSLALRTGLDKPFSCPECRKDTTLPQGSVDNLQAAFFVNRLKEVHSKLERATGKVEAKCEMCSGAKAGAFCRQCAMFICAECVKQHQRMKVFTGHKTSSLAELKEGGAKEFVREATLQTCNLHEQPMNIFCFDCGCLICRDCTIRDHHGHNHEFIKKAAPEAKKRLTQHLDPLKEAKASLSCAVKEIQTTRSEVEAQGHSVASYIESSFEEISQIIEQRKQELLTDAAMKMTTKLERLSGQEKSLSTTSAMVQSVIEYAEQCIEHSADDEIMCMQAELQSRIDREIEEQQKEGKNLEPVEEADMAVEMSCVEELKQLCQTKTKIIRLLIDPSKCTVTGKGTQSAEISEASEIVLNTKLNNGKPTEQKCVIECHLKTLVDGSTTKCKVDAIKGGEYRIQYTPTVRGRHELTVTVNGVEVANSPFPVFVSIHPSKLGKPVRVIPDLKGPSAIAINSESEIIVTELAGDVVALDKKGNRLRNMREVDPNLKRLCGVTVDEDDNIYFVSAETNFIYKSDKQMRKVSRKNVKEKQTSGHLCVAVTGNDVLVCEPGNKGAIKVYNRELQYMREITLQCANPGLLIGISPDEHDNLYVSDRRSSIIHVIGAEREVLRSFGQELKKPLRSFGQELKKPLRSFGQELKKPCGIHVSGQYVYVADWASHNVSIFTREGEHVASFGQEGAGEGDFNHPCGVCVDRDGFVYVCDAINRRLQIF